MKTLPKLLMPLYCLLSFAGYSQDLSIDLEKVEETYSDTTKENDSVYTIKFTCSSCENKKREFNIKIESTSKNSTITSFSPKKMMFGEGFKKEQELIVNFEDKEGIRIHKLKVEEEIEESANPDTTDETDDPINKTTHLIFQKENSSPAVVRLKKTTEEIKSGLEMLKKQLKEGDSAKEYIGRFVIKQKATVFKS